MKNYKLAWRNLWRNRRRTLITSASVFFAVFFALLMRSLQIGSYDYMYRSAIESYSGYIQVQQELWWDEKTIDNSFAYSEDLRNRLLENENVAEVIPRVESFALAAGETSTKGIAVMGIDPGKESLLSDLNKKLVKYRLSEAAVDALKRVDAIPEKTVEILDMMKGHYFSDPQRMMLDMGLDPEKDSALFPTISSIARYPGEMISVGEPGVLVGEKLADYLQLSTGDTLVLMGQGYHGTTAAGKYAIKGLFKTPIAEMSAGMVFLPYDIAQELYGAEDRITSMILHISDNSDKAIASTMDKLQNQIPQGTRLIDWREMNDVMIQQMEADNVSGLFMLGVLYLVIAFGIIGTILMMTAERRREFGVLVAIGMQKKKLASIMTWEMIYIGLLGLVAGIVVCTPIILYGAANPIIFKGELAMIMEGYDMEPKLVFEGINSYFLSQALVVGCMVLVSLWHPLRKILNLQVVNALRV